MQCENAFHGACLTPPIVGVPEGESLWFVVERSGSRTDVGVAGEWFCPKCSAEGEVVEEEEEEEASAGKKRKAGSAAVEKKGALLGSERRAGTDGFGSFAAAPNSKKKKA